MIDIYQDQTGKSGVYGFEMGGDFIIVYFKKGVQYKWTYESCGQDNVDQMKLLAQQGSGLNSYINLNCKDDYE